MAITKTISAKALVSGTNVLKIWTTGTNAGTIKKIRVIKSKEAGDIAKGVNLPGTVGAVAIPAGMSNALAEKFTKAWSQEGADVTSENTSADTAKVNGQDASVVQQNAANAKAAVDAQAEDGQISPAEKADWRINKPIMERNYNEAATYAFQLGVNHSDLDTKWAALVTYLEGAGVWSSPYSTYIISNNELVAKNDDYYAALLAVEQACIDQAADDAKNSAISTAATDATNKANTAQSDAEATARSEITGRGLDATGNFIGTVSG
ncbi:MAG TPA: hypothetical protein DHV36_16105, partial [Desulfobacteraceae bacterium]|nr:hypothetical protein [Desulfobacteraceae bacterium]